MYTLNGIKISHLRKQKIVLNIAWRGAVDFWLICPFFFPPPRIDMIFNTTVAGWTMYTPHDGKIHHEVLGLGNLWQFISNHDQMCLEYNNHSASNAFTADTSSLISGCFATPFSLTELSRSRSGRTSWLADGRRQDFIFNGGKLVRFWTKLRPENALRKAIAVVLEK